MLFALMAMFQSFYVISGHKVLTIFSIICYNDYGLDFCGKATKDIRCTYRIESISFIYLAKSYVCHTCSFINLTCK